MKITHPTKSGLKGVFVRLSDDGKKVLAIDFTHTKKEVDAAIQRMIEEQPK